jgi:hypothetical protein
MLTKVLKDFDLYARRAKSLVASKQLTTENCTTLEFGNDKFTHETNL